MIGPLLTLLLVTTVGTMDRPATAHFEDGAAARGNAAQAREHFRQSARAFENYPGTPAVALARGRAYFLAGDTPRSLAALREGLALAPHDADLQRDLAAVRETIRYPEPTDPRSRVRPDAPTTLRHRVSPWDALLAAVFSGTLIAIGVVRRFTTRPPWSVVLVGVGVFGFVASAFVAWRISIADERPLVVLTAETVLRKGNGTSYPARIAEPLPRGTEVREVGRRGGWVRVEVAGGAIGWVEESRSFKPSRASGVSPS